MTSPSRLPAATDSGPARFAAHADWFVASRQEGVECTTVWAVAERLVDHLHALSAHLGDPVDVVIADQRSGRRWSGALLPLTDVREALGRLRIPVAAFGGVEISIYTGEDQLTLTADLLLVIYARTARWSYLLDALGIEERASTPPVTWSAAQAPLREVPTLATALHAAVARLGLLELAS